MMTQSGSCIDPGRILNAFAFAWVNMQTDNVRDTAEAFTFTYATTHEEKLNLFALSNL